MAFINSGKAKGVDSDAPTCQADHSLFFKPITASAFFSLIRHMLEAS